MSVEGGADGGGGGGPDGGAPPGDAGAAPDGGGGQPAPFYEAFANADLKTNPSVHRYKSVEELAAGYVNLEKRYGVDPARRIDLPADPNDEAGMRAVFERLGAPKDKDGYGLKLAEGATEADKALVGGFGDTAHKLGLSVKQAQGLMEFMGQRVAADATAQGEALAARVAAGETALKTEWGAAYEARAREVEVMVEKYGDPELLAAIKGDGMKANPNLAKMLGKLVSRMAEPGGAGGDSNDTVPQTRKLTPAEAGAAVRALEADPIKGVALRDAQHPQHKAVVEERLRLTQQTA